MKKTVFITGASRGIGAACAIYFAKQGYDVAINYLSNIDKAQEVAETIRAMGQNAYIYQGDVADYEQMRTIIKKCTNDLGHIDVVVNNAGIAQQKLFTDTTPDEWHRMFSVNVDSIYNVLSCVLPQMINRKSGSVVNVSSMWGICGASCEVAYSASKSAVIGLTKALAQELAPSNIRVNCVAPGLIDTEMNNNLSEEDIRGVIEETPLGKIGKAEDIAKAIFFLADDEYSSFTTGQILSPNGGLVI
jgi:3-oxoacyl-[acyl-carrier protein] reductase